MGGNGGRPHLSAVTTWLKLIIFPFSCIGSQSVKKWKTGLCVSSFCVVKHLPMSSCRWCFAERE